MNSMKTLMLASFAALSFGVGSAMAQEGGGPSMPSGGHWETYWAPGPLNTRAPAAAQDQFGSSDPESSGYRANRGVSPNFYNYGVLANPG
jgi:hypothetical protein